MSDPLENWFDYNPLPPWKRTPDRLFCWWDHDGPARRAWLNVLTPSWFVTGPTP